MLFSMCNLPIKVSGTRLFLSLSLSLSNSFLSFLACNNHNKINVKLEGNADECI